MRILLKLIFIIVIITIAGLIALPFIIDPNEYKQEIAGLVEQKTGRKLTLEGDIGLSVFPWIALELGPLSLSNAKGFKADSFAKVDAVEIRIKLIPLLKKQLEMDTIVLDGLLLNLEKNKAGKTNWDDLASSDPSKESSEKLTEDTGDTGAPALAAISIAGVKLSNANIMWSDATTSENYQLENFNLNTDPLVPGEATAIDMSFNLLSAKPQAKAHIELNTKVMIDLEQQLYALTGLNFTVQAEGKELPFAKTDIALSADINADMNTQLITIDNLELSTKISDPSLPGGKTDIEINTNIRADLAKQTMTIAELAIQVQDLLINANLDVSKLLSDNPNIAGKLEVQPFNLRQLANRLAVELPPMTDGSTLELVQLNTEFTASSKHFSAKQLTLTLDQSKLTGQLAVTNFAKPAINFKLTLDEIDVDRYLPPASDEEKSTTAPPASSAAAGASQLPLETLRQINAKGTLDIGKLKASGTRSEKIHLELNAAKGLIKLYPLSANLYQGQYKGNVKLDARGKTLKLAISENLTGVQVGPLLKDMSGDDKISGTANAKIKLTGNGATVDQIKQTLSGNGQFSFTDGAVKGVNIAESIRKAKAALKGEKLANSGATAQTDFSSLTGSFKVTNGVINNQDLLVKSPLLRIDGAGTVDLPKEKINYALKVAIVGSLSGQDGKDLADLKGLTIPVKITGTFNEPKPTVDLASIFKEKATQEIKSKVADKLKDKVGGDLGGLLGGVLGTPTTETAPQPTKTEPTQQQEPVQEEPAKSPEDQAKDALKDKLKNLF